MDKELRKLIKDALENLDIEASESVIVLEHPEDLKNGDYYTNLALAIAKNLKAKPLELAEKIVTEISRLNVDKKIKKVEVGGPGFINFHLSREFFAGSVEEIVNQGFNVGKNETLKEKKIMVEYTDPNPFKPFHIGHLMTNAIGESIARILEHSGANVSRANYQGDIGLHVAKAIYGLLQDGGLQNKSVSIAEQSANIGEAYAIGSDAYEKDAKAKSEIENINQKIYDKSDEEINKIYDWGFKATMEAFEDLYKLLGTKFDFYFLESKVAQAGDDLVRTNLGKVFEESDGAIVFKAENYDPKLHTRVFITSKDLPTYETKEFGLIQEKFTVSPDIYLSIVVTANEQADYMRVVMKALSMINPEYAAKTRHITHGMMRLAGGKMSSRKGNVVTGETLVRDTIALVKGKIKENDWSEEDKNKIGEAVGVAAIKYSILRSKAGSDIIYNEEESISTEGDSGPYLQYSYARANSVLEKAQKENILPDFDNLPKETFEIEKLLYQFKEIVLRSASTYEPHHIANYLTALARSFNSFYGNTPIVDGKDKTSSYKIALTYAFSFVMKTGLSLLGIKAPQKM